MDKDNESPIKFPCIFPIKIMGKTDSNLIEKVVPIFEKYSQNFNKESIRTNESSKGNYISLTVMVNAVSKEQLDNIYMELTALKETLMVL